MTEPPFMLNLGSFDPGSQESNGLFLRRPPGQVLSVGEMFLQEYAPGVAEERFKVIALDQSVTTTAGTLTGCLKAEDSTPLEDRPRVQVLRPSVGLVREEPADGVVELFSYE